jgi:6,7-dimethyl-8-ribityllumazine synthase
MRTRSLPDREPLDAKGLTFALVVSRWNPDVTDRLLEGARSALRAAGARDEDVTIVHVPGAFELVSACRWEASREKSAVVSLGCLIRGETPHFDVLAHAVAGGLAQLNAAQDVPIAFGVLTCDDREQAMARAGGASGNAGAEAAEAAIVMARLRRISPRGREHARVGAR